MKNKILGIGMMMLMVSLVSAESCTSYFNRADSQRQDIRRNIDSLYISSGRFQNSVDDVVNLIDDLEHRENVSTITDDIREANDRKTDVNDDISDLETNVKDYDNEISDARSDLPYECVSVYNGYSVNYDTYSDYLRDIKREFNIVKTYSSILTDMLNSPSTHNKSSSLDNVEKLQTKVDDFYDTVGDSGDFRNFTSNEVGLMNQSTCNYMINLNIQKERSRCTANSSIVTKIINRTVNQTSTTICNTVSLQTQLDACYESTAKNQALFDSQIKNACGAEKSVLSSNEARIAELGRQITNLTTENAILKSKMGTDGSCTSGGTCSCTIYIVIAVVLALILIVSFLWGL